LGDGELFEDVLTAASEEKRGSRLQEAAKELGGVSYYLL
jgi:hypothetical protein